MTSGSPLTNPNLSPAALIPSGLNPPQLQLRQLRLLYHHHGNPRKVRVGGASGVRIPVARRVGAYSSHQLSRCAFGSDAALEVRGPCSAPFPSTHGTRATARRFPRVTPPFLGGRNAVLFPSQIWRDAKTLAGRGLRGRRPKSGPQGHHCDAPCAKPGIRHQNRG